jgi:hypothetical protein
MHDAILLIRQSIEEVDHIENGHAFAKGSLVFGNEYAAVNIDANAIGNSFNDRLAMAEP